MVQSLCLTQSHHDLIQLTRLSIPQILPQKYLCLIWSQFRLSWDDFFAVRVLTLGSVQA